jgi:hypothetical protein
MTEVTFRPLGPDEVEHVKWALFEAVAWNPDREVPPYELVVEHPELARYHRACGRPGDLGIVAELGGEVMGVALCRMFTEDDHGHGYVDPETPELAVAVAGTGAAAASGRVSCRTSATLPVPPDSPV